MTTDHKGENGAAVLMMTDERALNSLSPLFVTKMLGFYHTSISSCNLFTMVLVQMDCRSFNNLFDLLCDMFGECVCDVSLLYFSTANSAHYYYMYVLRNMTHMKRTRQKKSKSFVAFYDG